MGWFPVDPQFVTPEWLWRFWPSTSRTAGSNRSASASGLLGRSTASTSRVSNVPGFGGGEVSHPGPAGTLRAVRGPRVLCAGSALLPTRGRRQPAAAGSPVFRRDRRGHPRLRPGARGSRPASGRRPDRRVHAGRRRSGRRRDRPTTMPIGGRATDWPRCPGSSPSAAPPFPAVLAANAEAAWPRFLDLVGGDLSPQMRAFGQRLPSSGSVVLRTDRPPTSHLRARRSAARPVVLRSRSRRSAGDGVGLADQPARPRRLRPGLLPEPEPGTDTRRACEAALIERYRERLAECGIDYPAVELHRDYRMTVALCFIYPLLATGRIEVANDRQVGFGHMERPLTLTIGQTATVTVQLSVAAVQQSVHVQKPPRQPWTRRIPNEPSDPAKPDR